MGLLSEEYQNATDALRYDQMDLFYIDFTKMALKTITYTRGNFKSYDVYFAPMEENGNYLFDNLNKDQILVMENKIEDISSKIVDDATGTNYQKIQYIHNWLIDNVQYDLTYNAENNRDIYGAFVNGSVVCEGYAKSFKYLLDKLEIPCILVSGKAINSKNETENHMWNYVKINEIWYGVDVTWDDPIIENNDDLPDEYRYRYFCQGNNISQNHFLSNAITANCQEYEYPELGD